MTKEAKTLTVSLTRAHKIAERLKSLWNNAHAEAERLSAPANFSSRPSESTLADTAKAGQALFDAAKAAERYASAWSVVRNAIAAENHARGIDQLLTEMELLRKSKALWAKARSTSMAGGHLPAEAHSYQPENDRFGATFDLTINALRDPSTALAIKAAHDEHERKWIALQDTISEANVGKISITLELAVAQEITGVSPK